MARIVPQSCRWTLTILYNKIYWVFRALITKVTGQGWPPGHFYSPIPDVRELAARKGHLFNKDVELGPSIPLDEAGQLSLLNELARCFPEFDWQDSPTEGNLYYLGNGLFTGCDALVLYAMLRHFKPARVIEVGSGFSSALMLDTSRRFLQDKTHFTFIEPFSARLEVLLDGRRRDRCEIVKKRVQDVPLERFEALERNDVLFIDSSHVCKTGSDLNFLMFDVLPRISPGVIVHFHDILWPFEYPERWVLRLRWAWNEAYLLRAFLQYNGAFRILLFNGFLTHRFPAAFAPQQTRMRMHADSSLWLQKTAQPLPYPESRAPRPAQEPPGGGVTFKESA